MKMPLVGLILVVSLLMAAVTAEAGSVVVPGNFSVKVTSLKETRFSTVIQQQYDYSCGSAALATLLTYHYEDPVSEQVVLKAMFDHGDQEKIRKEGFSLLDMKVYLENNGYQADGFKVPLDRLREIGVPAIALINNNGYRHFVVIKGVTEKEVLTGDPSLGLRIVPRAEFEKMWNGLVFLARNKKNVAKNYFNRTQDWHVRKQAPLDIALTRRGLADVSLFLPVRGGLGL